MKKQSTKFKVLSTLLVILSVFGFLQLVVASDTAGKIEITKTATKKSTSFDETNLIEGRLADVTLKVKANSYSNQITSYSKLDVVLVLDASSSMVYGPNGKNDYSTPNRLDSAKTAAKEFINTMMVDKAVKIGMVAYNNGVSASQSLTDSKETVIDFIDTKYTTSQRTNLQSGIAKAIELLDGGRTDAKKLVIILTDGIPTQFNYTTTDGKTIVCGSNENSDSAQIGNGCPSGVKPSAAAKTTLDSLKTKYPNADVYTITLGNEEEAARILANVNPVATTTTHKYANVLVLNYEALAKEFRSIASVIKDIIAKNAKVTDIIPVEFELTEESKNALTNQGVVIKEGTNGTTLEWTIGDLKGNVENSLTYTIKAKDDYHGSIYTNSSATLSAEIDKDNPYYSTTTLNLTFDQPTVEIPAVIKDDHYSNISSYNGYENIAISGESILTNDLLNNIKNDKMTNMTDVVVNDEIIINTNTNVVKTSDNTYTISNNGVLQGTLVMNINGEFTFTPEANYTGEVSFTYYIKTTINANHETSYVESNDATVTLNIISSPKVSIKGEKTWDDANNQDGLRPNKITVRLFAGETEVTSQEVGTNGDWSYEFKDLPEYVQGYENDANYKINYEIKEDSVPGYEITYDGYNIKNIHTPSLVNITVKKIWNDNNNNDGLRPEKITVRLYKVTDDNKVFVNEYELTSDNSWTYEIKDLPEKENGKKITYTITEDEVEDYTGVVEGNMDEGFTITNTHTDIARDLTIEKVWQDSSNNDGKRPETITIRLYKLIDKELVEVSDTVVQLTSANAKTTSDNWIYTYKDLPKYENGNEITYIVREDELDSTLKYTTTYNDEEYKIFNTYETEVISIEGVKTWDDDNNRDGIRPDSIEVTLTGKVGEEVVYTETKTVSAEDDWSYKFDNLAKYYAGSIIDYKISESNVANYDTIITNYDITNTHTPDKITITGKKVWDDAEDQDGLRPETITVVLNKTVKDITTIVERAVIKEDEEGNWTFTFADLYAKEDGEDIKYTIDEITVEGYTKSIDDYTITNTHTPETISYNLTKNWDDYDNNDGIRPENISIKVYANEELVQTIEMNAENNWTASINDLPKYNNGEVITYSFVEDEVKGYEAIVSDSLEDNDNNYTVVIINYHEIETTELTITKVWDDEGHEDIRPSSITVSIYADDEEYESIEITAEDNWTYTLDNLQKYKKGQEIKYTIEEEKLEKYETSYDGYTITNSYKESGEITPPNTGVKEVISSNTYYKLIVFLLGALGITYTLRKRES